MSAGNPFSVIGLGANKLIFIINFLCDTRIVSIMWLR